MFTNLLTRGVRQSSLSFLHETCSTESSIWISNNARVTEPTTSVISKNCIWKIEVFARAEWVKAGESFSTVKRWRSQSVLGTGRVETHVSPEPLFELFFSNLSRAASSFNQSRTYSWKIGKTWESPSLQEKPAIARLICRMAAKPRMEQT